MQTNKVEFVGGPYDGEIVDVPADAAYVDVSKEYDIIDIGSEILELEGQYISDDNNTSIWRWKQL